MTAETSVRRDDTAPSQQGTEKPVFVSRFLAQPELALGDSAVAEAVARLNTYLEQVEYKQEFISEAIAVTVGERRIRSGSDLVRRLTFGRAALGQYLFEATRGRSLDLISSAQTLVNAVRDLVRRERAGELRPFVPARVRKSIEDEAPGMPTRAEQARKSWERIKPAPQGFGISTSRLNF
ncbi:hypothetical protein SAE02_61780 [Skermanella aerolata]|uniref:Uncharacterized protein n=1 Tax=Skermanella aerolata TaxID=393310 RepID=A0A512E0R7_9PROT|nr:hypothetical protein [Skermanella aerolata]GEO42030.1 hypothetical protein SAE02_61780 [Skermanella aerolata]